MKTLYCPQHVCFAFALWMILASQSTLRESARVYYNLHFYLNIVNCLFHWYAYILYIGQIKA